MLGGDARLELEVAAAPDREGIDGLLADRVLELRVHDLPVVQEDLAPEPAIHEMEHARLAADADELDDVREMKLG
jgi:hypothetical protein